jgi:hypothetical protein
MTPLALFFHPRMADRTPTFPAIAVPFLAAAALAFVKNP